MSEHPKATRWFDPYELAFTGVRSFISGIFGEFADRREMQASYLLEDGKGKRPIQAYGEGDADDHGDFWIDYVADTGDGWNQTRAIAELLSKPELILAEERVPRGRILVMGGDQVYPLATPDHYQQRLVKPFDEAAADKRRLESDCPRNKPRLVKQPNGEHLLPEDWMGDLYAIPGNHDWYDGLRAFAGLFMRNTQGLRLGAVIGGRRTRQMRSYFAIRLPGGWWLWGIDSQLEGYIDQPQVDYFAHVAKHEMEPNAKLIICTGYPSWTRVDVEHPGKRFGSFAYMERLASNYSPHPLAERPQVKLSISGDTHHYARHTEDDGARHYVTCGGGGAYTHPTSQFTDLDGSARKEEFRWRWPKPGEPRPGDSNYKQGEGRCFEVATKAGTEESALYPDAETSRLEALWCTLFAFINWRFSLMLAVLYGLLFWQLELTGATDGMAEAPTTHLLQPWTLFQMLVGWIVFQGVMDTHNKWLRYGGAFALTLLQTAIVFALAHIVVEYLPWPGWAELIAAAFAGGFAAATVMGWYFLIAFQLTGAQWNEVFAGIGITRYKSLLRIRIDRESRLTLYAIGLRETCQPWWRSLFRSGQRLPAPHLIEKVELG